MAIDEVVAALEAAAYSRVDLVEKRGEYAVRGGIVDVFPPTQEHPLRVEFFGDEIDDIRYFAVADQRTLEETDRVWAPPCRELLLTPEVRARAKALGADHPELAELTEKLAEGIAVEGMESLSPALVDEMELLTDLMPENTTVLALDPERVRSRSHDLVATSEEFLGASWAAAASGGEAPIDLGAASLRSLADVRTSALARGISWWGIGPFAGDEELDDTAAPHVRAVPAYRGDIEAAVRDLREQLDAGRTVVTVHSGAGPAARMVEVLGEHDIPARLVDDLGGRAASDGVVLVTHGSLASGLLTDRVAVITGEDIAGQKASTRDMRKMPVAAQEADRPAGAQGRRLRRARAARRRPVHRDEAARGARRGARVPRAGVRRLQAWPPTRPALRAGRRARPGRPATSAASSPASTGSAAATGPSARAGPARRSSRSRPS